MTLRAIRAVVGVEEEENLNRIPSKMAFWD
jgi:hypothetical protein